MRLHEDMTDTAISAHPAYIAGTWTLDPAHSEITFSVRHLAISKVRGSFEKFDVTVETAEGDEDPTITATIDVSSVNTGVEARDQHLRTSDFFLVEEHPTAVFTAKSFVLDGDDVTIDGELTLRGVTQPVQLKAEFGGIVTDAYGNTKAGVSATTTFNRRDFGVNWNAALEAGGMTLGDDVTLNIELQFALQK
jgi:polyisoprenoid-binding protein YceI